MKLLDSLVTAVLASNGVFRKAMDTQFIIIVDKDTMVFIIYMGRFSITVHFLPANVIF